MSSRCAPPTAERNNREDKMQKLTSFAKFSTILAALGLAARVLDALPAAAQPIGQFEPISFALQNSTPDCPSSKVCHFDFSLPDSVYIRQVACRNFLLSGSATEIATLTLYPGTAISKSFPLIPVKVTGNSFTVSQRVVVAAFNFVRITIQSFGAGIVAGAHCTISGIGFSDPYELLDPFSLADQTADCNDDRTVCTFEVGPVPANRRWVLQQVACRNNLLSSTATEIVTLSTVNARGKAVASFPLIPEKLTGNSFTVNQRIAIHARAAHKVRINIQSFGAGIVAFPTCTLSGWEVGLPPE
jgi:hypothetical protein